MRFLHIAGLASCLALAGVSTGAFAQEQRVVAAGKRTLVGQFALYAMDTCYAGAIPEARIATQPQNGRLEFAQEAKRAPAGNCGNMTIWFRTVYYIPKPGFRGTDNASVDFLYSMFTDAPNMTNRRQSYSITVK